MLVGGRNICKRFIEVDEKISELTFITSDFPDIFHWCRISGIILYQNFAYAFRLQYTLLFIVLEVLRSGGLTPNFLS